MRDLEITVGDCDDFRVIMACHGSTEGEDLPCIGYIAREGRSNLRVRLLVTYGRSDLGPILSTGEQWDLYDTYWEMRQAMEDAASAGERNTPGLE